MQTTAFHTLIIGAGAAGMMCAARIGQRGHRAALLDHATKIGEKIRISGGGRCNFTNRHLNGHDGSQYYVSQQPRFVRHALSRYTAQDFIRLVEQYGIAYHEKHKGQLFCDGSAQEIIAMLQNECAQGQVSWHTGCQIEAVARLADGGFEVRSSQGIFRCINLIVASGGLAVPAIGATPFGYELAKQFGHSIIPPEAALVPLRFEHWQQHGFDTLSGIALPVRISTGSGKSAMAFDEDLLFRHKGLSGPAILQISSYWQPGQTLHINLVPDCDLAEALCGGKNGQKIQLNTALKQLCPARAPARFLAEPSRLCTLCRTKMGGHPQRRTAKTGQQLEQLDAAAQRFRRPQKSRSHPRRGERERNRPENHAKQIAARPVFYRRSDGHHRLARRLQLPMGMGFSGMRGRSGGVMTAKMPV